MRHISQLKKESRKKENKIQSLEADAQRKAIIMKRRADEVIITSLNGDFPFCDYNNITCGFANVSYYPFFWLCFSWCSWRC